MKIIMACELGYCSGIRHAVTETERILQSRANVVATDTLLHNACEMARLSALGLKLMDKVGDEELRTATILLPAHGSTAEERGGRLAMAASLVNLTCPIVERAHAAAARLAAQHIPVLIVGDREHRETRYLVEAAGVDLLAVVSSAQDLDALASVPPRLGIVYQTTQSRELRRTVLEWCRNRGSRVLDQQTLCPEVLRRQDATALLAQKSTVMLVLGDRSSANTSRLFSVAEEFCGRSYLIAGAADLQRVALEGTDVVGIVSGTSCPQSFIDEVIAWFHAHYPDVEQGVAP